MGFYDDMAAMAADMLASEDDGGFGVEMTITRLVPQDERTDDETGLPIIPEPEPDEYTVMGVLIPVYTTGRSTLAATLENFVEEKKLIEGRIKVAFVAALGLEIEPSAGDMITTDGEEYRIIGNSPVNPTGTAVLHQLLLEK